MKILVADDQQDIRSALRLLLEQEPEVHVVGEVAEAAGLVAQIKATQPDLVLLDWELTGLRPTALRTHCPGVKVIALSGRPEARREAFEAGAYAFVSKGDSPEHLLAILHAAIADDKKQDTNLRERR